MRYNQNEVIFIKYSVLEKLEAYNDDELFYREYHQCRNQPQKLKELLSHIGTEEIHRRGLLVAEIDDSFAIPFEMGEEIFYEKETQNICLSKHNRYTPEFLHSHTFFEMIYVLNGSCRHTISGKTILMSSGTFCIVSPHVYHAIGVFDDSIVLNILIRTSTLEELYGSILKSDNPISTFLIHSIFSPEYDSFLQFHGDNDDEIQHIILAMYQEQCESANYSEEIINHLMSILLYRLVRSNKIYTELSKTQIKKNDDVKIYRYFWNHYQKASLEELADSLGYTSTYCSAYIKKATGFTFSKLRKMIIFRKAKELLTHTSLSIQHISEHLGYRDSENFIRAFQKEYGISPTQFRKSAL